MNKIRFSKIKTFLLVLLCTSSFAFGKVEAFSWGDTFSINKEENKKMI